MTEKFLRQIKAQKSVMDVMESNLPVWQSVPEVRKSYDSFVRNIKKIDDCLTETETNLDPLKNKLRLSKASLIGQVLPVAGVMGVFAADTGDKKLCKLADMKFADLEKMKTGALRRHCLKVLTLAENMVEVQAAEETGETAPVISGYGLTKKHLEKLRKAFDSFCDDADTFSNARKKTIKGKTRLKGHIRDNILLLSNKMDRMMLLFRESQKEFHDAYFKARQSDS